MMDTCEESGGVVRTGLDESGGMYILDLGINTPSQAALGDFHPGSLTCWRISCRE